MSVTLPDDQMKRALDAALRDVLKSAPQKMPPREHLSAQDDREQPPHESPLALDQTMDVVSRAALIIDELVERNRSITDAAVRSVEGFRTQAFEARAEAERLREELRVVKEQSEAQCAAALAHAEELEAELGARNAALDQAEAWIGVIRSQVERLLGDAQTRLAETVDESIFRT